VEPGSVTPLALVNDREARVTAVLDAGQMMGVLARGLHREDRRVIDGAGGDAEPFEMAQDRRTGLQERLRHASIA
jgi:hypothetical protein